MPIMKPIREMLRQCWTAHQPCVIATIIKVDGSAYRREGSRCLIHEDGAITGILSGGCLESDLREHAHAVLETGQPKQLYYDFRWNEDEVWGVGIGCNGAITVWLEPFDPIRAKAAAVQLLQDEEYRVACEQSWWAVTVLESADPVALPLGSRVRLDQAPVLADGGKVEQTGIVSGCLQKVNALLFAERIDPRPRLTIIGSGADAALLCAMAAELQWHVTVADHRPVLLEDEGFAAANVRIVVPRGDFTPLLTGPDRYVVVMTHHLELDIAAVSQLIAEEVAYIGIVSSRKRAERIVESVLSGNPDISREHLTDKLFAPIGLDIGAQSPEEITLSIMGELIAVQRGKAGVGSLRDRRKETTRSEPAEGRAAKRLSPLVSAARACHV